MHARALALVGLLATPAAWAQPYGTAASERSDDSGASKGEDSAFIDHPALHPGPGRVPVTLESSRGGPIGVGISAIEPRAVRPEARFTDEVGTRLCRTPCTLYLRPGARSLLGDVDTGFPWAVDVSVPRERGLRVRLRGHLLGYSALGGAFFIMGVAGAAAGPALVVVSAIVGEPRLPASVMIVGGAITVVGALAIWGGLSLLGFAAPRVESATAISPRAWRPSPRPRVSIVPAIGPEGALVVSSLRF